MAITRFEKEAGKEWSYRMLNRQETCDHISESIKKGRVAVSRYADGEYFLMNHLQKVAGSGDESDAVGPFLRNAITNKGQLVCINEVKPKNVRARDKWFKTHRYLANAGKQEIYGSANWNVDDYARGSKVLHRFFQGKVLIISGHTAVAKKAFAQFPNIEFMDTPDKNAFSKDRSLIERSVSRVASGSFDNVIISAGKASKVMLVEMLPVTNANIIDMGAVLNAILETFSGKSLVDSWGMSWAKIPHPKRKNSRVPNKVLLNRLSVRFFEKLK